MKTSKFNLNYMEIHGIDENEKNKNNKTLQQQTSHSQSQTYAHIKHKVT